MLTGCEILTKSEWTSLVKSLSLPRRQVDIARLITRGFSDKRIAEELGITVPTVRTHLSRMFARLKVQDRGELVLFLVQQSWSRDGRRYHED